MGRRQLGRRGLIVVLITSVPGLCCASLDPPPVQTTIAAETPWQMAQKIADTLTRGRSLGAIVEDQCSPAGADKGPDVWCHWVAQMLAEQLAQPRLAEARFEHGVLEVATGHGEGNVVTWKGHARDVLGPSGLLCRAPLPAILWLGYFRANGRWRLSWANLYVAPVLEVAPEERTGPRSRE